MQSSRGTDCPEFRTIQVMTGFFFRYHARMSLGWKTYCPFRLFPHSGPAAVKSSETKTFPQPSSVPFISSVEAERLA